MSGRLDAEAIEQLVGEIVARRVSRRHRAWSSSLTRAARLRWRLRIFIAGRRRRAHRSGGGHVVVSVLIGPGRLPPAPSGRGTRAVCFTDQPHRVPRGWEARPIEYWAASDRLTTEWVRCHLGHMIIDTPDGVEDITMSWLDPTTGSLAPAGDVDEWWRINGEESAEPSTATTGSLRWIGDQESERTMPRGRRPTTAVERDPYTVIIPVHDAPDHVSRCLESVIATLGPADRWIVVDDGSADPTSDLCRRMAEGHAGELIEHDVAVGFPAAANAGMARATTKRFIVLNSDTVVAPGWIDRLDAHFGGGGRVAAVGPLSNNARFQSVPFLLPDDVSVNDLPDGLDLVGINRFLERWSIGVGPVRVPLLSGFCLAIDRGAYDILGGFDAEAFGRGFGEENDWCLRAVRAGFDLVIATDVYVHHAKGASFDQADVDGLKRSAGEVLHQRYGLVRLERDQTAMRTPAALSAVRADTQALWADLT